MKFRQEIIGDARLILGDNAEVIEAAGSVDLVLTDPPYGIDYGRAGGFSAAHGWASRRGAAEWDKERPARAIFDAMLGCSKAQVIWGGNYFTDYLPPTMQWLVWDKGQRDFSLADCDIACRRIEEAYRQPRLFEEPPAKPIQPDMLEAAE